MRLAPFLAVFTFAGAAHADGFFVTLNGVRTSGAQFQTTTATAPTLNGAKGQTPRFSSAHLELDEWGALLLPSLTSLTNGTKGTALVEFTKPDARGVEQVYLTASFSNVVVTRWEASFAPSKSTNVIDFAYERVVYTSTSGAKEEVASVKRTSAAAPGLDDAVMNGIIVGSAPHLVSSSIAITRVFDAMTGNVGPLKASPVTVVRTHALTPLTIKSITELDFLQKGAARFAFEVENASLTSVSGDTVIFTFPKAKLLDKTVGSQVAMTL
jgi:hypothetical protein